MTYCNYLSSDWLLRLLGPDTSLRATNLIRLNASHLHWISAADLSRFIKRMPNLLELNIEDTKISLVHLPDIFHSCKQICRLSFTLTEKNLKLEMTSSQFALLEEGLNRVTHLKLSTFAQLKDDPNFEHWLVTLRVLM